MPDRQQTCNVTKKNSAKKRERKKNKIKKGTKETKGAKPYNDSFYFIECPQVDWILSRTQFYNWCKPHKRVLLRYPLPPSSSSSSSSSSTKDLLSFPTYLIIKPAPGLALFISPRDCLDAW